MKTNTWEYEYVICTFLCILLYSIEIIKKNYSAFEVHTHLLNSKGEQPEAQLVINYGLIVKWSFYRYMHWSIRRYSNSYLGPVKIIIFPVVVAKI